MNRAARPHFAAGLVLFSAFASPAWPQEPPAPPDPAAPQPGAVYLQEKYVPEETFLRLQKENPGGIVMTLPEYRALVVKALRVATAENEAPLPPVESAVRSAKYEGIVQEKTARFTARLVVELGKDEWVFCALGRVPENLGTVRVDGTPGWLVLQKPPVGETEGRVDVPQEGTASLVVRGKGIHEVELTFHLPVEEKEGDRFAVSGPLPRSLAAELELVVPGKAEGSSEPGLLAREVEERTTRFRLGLGASERFRIEWRSRETLGENAPLLLASHRVLCRPSLEDPRFWWEATVDVARRAVSEVVFEEPAGTRVVGIEGPLVHSYRRDGTKIAVLLREELLGGTSFRFHGVLDSPGERLVLGVPALVGAYTNWGFLGLADPGTRKLSIESSEHLEELAVAEASLPAAEPREPSAPEPLAVRAFRFRSSDARLVLVLAERPVRFEAASASALVLGETAAFLHGSWQIATLDGGLHELAIRLPPLWKFVSLAERSSLGVASDVVTLAEGQAVLLRMANAARKDRPLEFDLSLELTAYPADRSWKEWALDLPLPSPAGALRHESTLGVFLARPLDLGATDLEGWHPAGAREIALVGIGLDRPEEARLAASFWTDRPEPVVKARLSHRASRGEYRAVTHLLAAENRMRVRCDLVLAVVDTGLDELVFRLPALPEGVPVSIVGPELREVKHRNPEGLHEVRFAKPWVGLRPFRIEYDLENPDAGSLAVPVVETLGDFGGERFLVLQSQGSVEVSATPGPGLMAVDGDEIPGFAEEWSRGRFLGAYRIVSPERRGATPDRYGGTVERVLYDRAPVLPNVIRRMDLATEIGTDGTLRTEVEILLAYSGLQALSVEMPAGASLAGVTVAGEPIRTVWKREGALSVPLPPRSYAILTLVYEESGREARRELGDTGGVELAGPVFLDGGGNPIPSGETTWKLHPPRGYRFEVAGGNLQGPDAQAGLRWPGFAGSFPRFTTWDEGGAGEPGPWEIVATRMGGDPRIELSYERLDRGRGTRKGVFLSVLLAAALLYSRRRRAPFWWFAAGGLAAGTLLPVALSWDSTLLLVPASEALLCALALAGVLALARRVRPYLHKPLWGTRGAVLVLALVLAGASIAQDVPPREPFDSVWVSSGPAEPPPDPAPEKRVFLTEDQFHRLHGLAFPDEKKPEPFSLDLAAGAASYRLDLSGETFELTATLPVHLFGSSWGTLEIPRGAVPLVSLALDGKECGIFGDSKVEIEGEGDHELALKWRGEVETVLGVSSVRAPLLGGPAATLAARLPEGAELRSAGGALAVVEGRDVTIDLGRARELELSWHFPREEGARGSLLSSASYSGLTLSPYGYAVERYEEVAVSGRPVDRLEYRIAGDFEIASVSGDEVSEWIVAAEAAQPAVRRLRMFFKKELSTARFVVRGWANLEAEAPLATLVLAGASREESYVGLAHGSGRRFAADVLAGMRRATLSDVRGVLQIPAETSAERVYYAHASGEGELMRARGAPRVEETKTDAVLLVTSDRLRVFARVEYQKSENGALRYEVVLPTGWEVRAVLSSELRDWAVRPREGGSVLAVELAGRARPGTEIVWVAERRFESVPESLSLPYLAGPARAAEEEGAREIADFGWVVAAEDGLSLAATDTTHWERALGDENSKWVSLPRGHSYRNLAFRTKRADSSLAFSVKREKERWSLSAVSVVRVTGDYLLANTRLLIRVRQGEVRRLRLRLPEKAELVLFETENLKSRRVTDGEIEIELASPVATEHPLLLFTRLPRQGLAIPPLLALAASGADGQAVPVEAFVALLAPSRPFAVEERVTGLARVALEELPFAPAGLARDAVQSAYKSTSPSWRLELSERGIEVVPGDAVVEVADLHTSIGEDGLVRTRAQYTVRHSGVQFLSVELPRGASLWGVTAGGWPVSVGTTRETGKGGGTCLAIPIEDLDRSNLPVVVTLYYEEEGPSPSFLVTTRSLSSPRLLGEKVKVTKTVWTVEVPDGYWVEEELEEMRLVPASRKYQERVEDLLAEKSRVEEILASTTNERARARANRDMARLEQILGDEIAELEKTNRSAGEREQADKIGEKELESQWALNDSLIQKAQVEQMRLRDLRDQETDQRPASREEALFLESLRFLEGRDWVTRGAPGEARPGAAEEAELPGRPRPFQGWAGRGWPALPAIEERSVSLAQERALAADSAASSGPGPLEVPGAEAFEPHAGRMTYTFQSLGSEANLEIELTRQQSSVQTGSWGLLLLALAAAGWVGYRSRKTIR